MIHGTSGDGTERLAQARGALERGAHRVQIDLTEGRLALKLDPSGQLPRSFIDLNRSVRLLTVVRAGGSARHRCSQRRKVG
jgi:hypothetical protein